jgi:hypothetical protein
MKSKGKRVRARQTLGREIIEGLNTPGGPAARLLQIAESHPEVVLASVRER